MTRLLAHLTSYQLGQKIGAHVRGADGYRRLLEGAFGQVDLHIRDDLSRLPYTFAIDVARKEAA